jgi:glycosyltransferase involved in cell wall biosynthesis
LICNFCFAGEQPEKITDKPKIAVAVPIYKVEKYLKESLESLRNQTFKDIIIICVNDASPDNSQKILNEHAKKDRRIVVLNHKENKGVSAARNTALNFIFSSPRCDSVSHIYFFDPDDLIHPSALKTAYDEMQKGGEDIFCFGYKTNIQGNKGSWWMSGMQRETDEKYEGESIIGSLFENPRTKVVWDKIYKKEVIGLTRFSEKMRTASDTCFNMMIFPKAKKIRFIKNKFYTYRIDNANSILHVTSSKEHMNSRLNMIKLVCNDWRRLGILEKHKLEMLKTLISMTAGCGEKNRDYTAQLEESFGVDVFNKKNIEKLPKDCKLKISKMTCGKY